jgi:DNA-binding transcriptional regulator YdaS (Cro superfamily)
MLSVDVQKPLQRAIALVEGGQSGLARAIGGTVKQGHVWYWLHAKDGQVPAEYCQAIEAATGGRVTRFELRPDVFGGPDEAREVAA